MAVIERKSPEASEAHKIGVANLFDGLVGGLTHTCMPLTDRASMGHDSNRETVCPRTL
jgi:hypothetical protein